MKTPWTERHGGIWIDRAASSDTMVIEEYDSVSDAFTVIRQRASDGHFQVEYLVKARDPQWSLPFWGDVASLGIYETLEDARMDLSAFIDEYRQRVTGS